MGICDGCHSGCCRAFAVPITGADIIRLESALNLSFWDFGCRWADADGHIARQHAPHFHFADEPETPFVICLRHEESQLFPGVTGCGFLQESPADKDHPLGMAHCGVYDHRPMSCRAFPVRMNETSELAVLYDIPTSGRADRHPQYTLCPRPWKTSDVDPIEQVQDLVVCEFEMSFFRKLAAIWNRVPQEWEAFPQFIQNVYSRRVVDRQTGTVAIPLSRFSDSKDTTIEVPVAKPITRAA
ncbi:MAG: YkgJ family cysteine cluster protein [Planctomycetaceae bacterium]